VKTKVWWRILLATITIIPLSGISASVALICADILIPSGSKESWEPLGIGLFFGLFGGIFIVPAAFIVQIAIALLQSRFRRPSWKNQILCSALCGVLFAYVLNGGGPGSAHDILFLLMTGFLGGCSIGWLWYILVTNPTHQNPNSNISSQ
jgi:ABC-type Fe3+ transport system permease subunit